MKKRIIRSVLMVVIALVAIGFTVVTISGRLNSVGPADFHVKWDTYWQLKKELGPATQSTGINILSFTPSASGGEYRVYFYHDQQRGYIYWRYDRAQGLTFERIEKTGP